RSTEHAQSLYGLVEEDRAVRVGPDFPEVHLAEHVKPAGDRLSIANAWLHHEIVRRFIDARKAVERGPERRPRQASDRLHVRPAQRCAHATGDCELSGASAYCEPISGDTVLP